ncbi:DUF6377 domain-containing protein [Hymenobacter canadensis]|uniref:DUF6377 domain-containing protein n=1 Tax=Hymenobacter canadensis TaxID=2999067 RepID=A0ABY7LVK7_9BACT|nr:DUF6377 domain-containing protein [Hymenobacter canadensis]WBA43300.1 DUF6377 domain-containing protein [Hymenobacter canadensis]
MRILLLVFAFTFQSLMGRAQPAAPTPLLRNLQTALAHKTTYDQQRQQRIAVLTAAFRASPANPEARFGLGLRIYEEYKAFQYDSAFVYSQQLTQLARQLNSPEKTELARLKLAFILLSSGMFKETFEELSRIRPVYLSRADRQDFYFLQARAYSDLGDFNQDQVYRPAYHARALAYADSALRYSRPGSYEQLAVQQFKTAKSGQLRQGLALYRQIQRLPQLTQHQLAVSASTTAYIHTLLGQEDQAFALLLVSAAADVKSATKETVAIFQLSEYCYRRGDLENAYAFIKEARAQATFYKARQRQLEISHISSVIEGQKISIIEQQRRSLRLYAGAVTLLALFVVAFIGVIWRQLRKLQRAGRLISATNQALQERNQELGRLNTGLHEASQIKQEYIGYYFHNNSQLLDRLETLKKALDTQLGSKQYGAVQRLVSGLNIRQQRQELLRGFDAVFLRLFPQFIPQFNALFRPEDQFQLPDDQLLSTELRIFALIRLGIQDSEQISRMLGYSINTIYTYKTRVKNRSTVPNEEFEARIMAIEAV